MRTSNFFLVIFVALSCSWTRVGAEVIHIGLATPGLYEVPTEIAKRKGFYREEGLEVRFELKGALRIKVIASAKGGRYV